MFADVVVVGEEFNASGGDVVANVAAGGLADDDEPVGAKLGELESKTELMIPVLAAAAIVVTDVLAAVVAVTRQG